MKKWITLFIATLFPHIVWAADVQANLQWSQRVELSTSVSGNILVVHVDAGDLVKKGQVLLSLDGAAYQAQVDESRSEITRLTAEADEDKRELDRVLELHERTIVATTELDQAKLKLIRSQSALSEAQARLRRNQKALSDTSIRAPFDAVVILRQAEPGQSVAAGLQPQTLLTLARSGEMIARMHLPSSQLDQLKSGQPLPLTVGSANYTGKIKTLGMEPVKIKEEWLYPVDVLFSVKEKLRAGTPALVKIP